MLARCWLVALIAGAAPCSAAAQTGQVSKVGELLGATKYRIISTPDTSARIRRAGRWDFVLPRASLFPKDTLRLNQFYNAEVDVNLARQRGRINFLPELLNQNRGPVQRAVSLGRFSDAVYRLQDEPTGVGNFGIVIERGALIVDWREGVLPVVAAGTRMPITGTRLAVATQRDSGYVYLDEGTMSFADFPQITVSAGQMYWLRRGVAPVLMTPPAAELRELQRAIRTHAPVRPVRSGLERLLYLGGHPAITIGGVAALGVGGWLIVRELTADDGGSIIVTIPIL